MKRLKDVFRLIVGLMLSSSALALDASKPLTLMVPYPAGGVSDSVARIFAGPLGKELGQTVLVENLGGASGAIGAQKVLTAPADGQYVLQASPNEVILSPLANAAVKLRPEDFRLVQPIRTAVMVVLARKDLPANSIDELISLARASKDKPLTYGTAGVGSLYHLLAEQMQRLTGTKMTHIPYKGNAPILKDLIGGEIDFTILPLDTSSAGMVEQRRFKLLATLGPARNESLKNVPTVAESQALKGYAYVIWTGYMVRKDTPEDVVQRLHRALGAVIEDPAVRAQLGAQFQVVSPATPLADSARFYEAETARYRDLAKSIGLQPQ